MPTDFMRQEHRLAVEQRGDDPLAAERKPYRTSYYPHATEDKALVALAEWEASKQNILNAEENYIVNWTAHIEQRMVRLTPWERLET